MSQYNQKFSIQKLHALQTLEELKMVSSLRDNFYRNLIFGLLNEVNSLKGECIYTLIIYIYIYIYNIYCICTVQYIYNIYILYNLYIYYIYVYIYYIYIYIYIYIIYLFIYILKLRNLKVTVR